MTKNNDFELENGSNDFFSMISGREYFKQTYDILMDSDKFGKDDLFNFLMNFPNFIPKKGNYLKSDLAKYAAIVLSNSDLMEQWYKNLPENQQDFLKEFKYKSIVPTDYAVKKYRLTIEKSKYHSWYDDDEYDWSSKDNTLAYFIQYDSHILTLKPVVFFVLRNIPELKAEQSFLNQQQLDNYENYFSETDGMEVFDNIQNIIQVLEDTEFFERDAKKPLIKKHKGAIKSICDLTPFVSKEYLINEYGLDSETAENLENLRSDIVMKFIQLTNGLQYDGIPVYKSKKDLPPQQIIKELFLDFFKNDHAYYEFAYLFPHLHTNYKGQMAWDLGYFKEENHQETLEYFKNWNFTDAISTDYLYAQSIPQFSTVDYNFYAIGELPKNDEKHFYNIRFTIPVYRGNFRPLFLEPVFNNFLLTAAAFGLFEIIWDFQPCEPGELELYKFGKIKYIRMTTLGEYVFGKTETFTYTPKTLEITPINLKENLPVIECPAENKIALRVIKEVCENLKGDIYLFSREKSQKKYKSQAQIESLFQNFERYSQKELPANWKKIRDDLLKKIFTPQYQYQWHILELPPENRDLIEAVTEIIKYSNGKILKVEGYKIAIQENYISDFERTLRNMGFTVI